MERILGNPKIRRLFYVLFILVLGVLIVIKYFFHGVDYVDSIVNDLIASIFTTVLIGSFAFYVFPRTEDLDFKIVEPTRIQVELSKGRISTDFWYFTGGTGIFTRAVTLPELAKQARLANKPIEIKLQIIDPLNIDICLKYAEYRRGLNTASNQPQLWNFRYVRNQSFATIVKSIIISSQEPLIDISIRLKNHFSLFRVDASSSSVIVTKEDPREVAFVFYRNSTSFNSYCHEFKETNKQAKPVKDLSTDIRLEDLDIDKVSQILEGVDLLSDISQNDLKFILKLVKDSKNPYA